MNARLMRCARYDCRTSLTEDDAVFCPHGEVFCRNCTWEEVCISCALPSAVDRVAAIVGPQAPAAHPRPPANNPPGDLTVGDLEARTARSLRWCRVCDQAIHLGSPMVTHWPDSPRTVVSFDFHPTCLPEGTLP